jgi:hypothetical protein
MFQYKIHSNFEFPKNPKKVPFWFQIQISKNVSWIWKSFYWEFCRAEHEDHFIFYQLYLILALSCSIGRIRVLFQLKHENMFHVATSCFKGGNRATRHLHLAAHRSTNAAASHHLHKLELAVSGFPVKTPFFS